MIDCYMVGNGVRIDNYIRSDFFICEWYVLYKEINGISYFLYYQYY